jgi:hypothetical protein
LTICETIERQRAPILRQWRQTMDSERRGTTPGTSGPGSRFTDPLGHTIEQGTEALFDWVISRKDRTEIRPVLEDICRLRAVQDFSPAQAVGFILALKASMRTVLMSAQAAPLSAADWATVEERIDSLLLEAFDEYASFRERIASIRIDEIKRLYGRDVQQ